MKRIIFLLLPLAVACSQPKKESAEDEAKRRDVERMYQQVEEQGEATARENREREEAFANLKVSFFQAEMFMTRQLKQINEMLLKTATVKLEDGSTFYVFLSLTSYGRLCISVVSDAKCEVLASECGTEGRMYARWDRIITTQSFD